MARKGGLPKGTLDTLIDETNEAEASVAAVTGNEKIEDSEMHEDLPVRTRNRKAAKTVRPYTTSRSKKKVRPAAPRTVRPATDWETDPVSRYAASRGLPASGGPLPAIRLAMQLAMDVREVARKERSSVFGVVGKALAGYLNAYDRR